MTVATSTFRAAGASDVGRQRLVNEDRFHVDPDGGVFIVVDGVGGQAAGGKAADIALETIRARLARETGPLAGRIREAITLANNEVHRVASSRPEWRGMACVLTVAVVDGPRVVVGHVGDTRLYKLRSGTIQKITSDHSPVGEREDAGEIAELDAMRHPRRHEVFRDVGSEPHEPGDANFIDIHQTTWEPDASLLLCSDGLTDLVASDVIRRLAATAAGQPQRVAEALVTAANDAGGRDNVTVVYVEGQEVASGGRRARRRPTWWVPHLLLGLLVITALGAGWRAVGSPLPEVVTTALGVWAGNVSVVGRGQSIAAALAQAAPGATILVEPGEYRERLTLRSDVRLISRVPRAAILRLPGTATDEDAAVTAVDVANAEFAGFTIVGDAATPLGTGILTRSASVRLLDLDVSGAVRVGIDLGPGDDVLLAASEVHDNPGAGLALRDNATARVAHNEFRSNGSSAETSAAIVIELGARPMFHKNVFRHLDPHGFAFLDDASRARLKDANHFPDSKLATDAAQGRGRGR